MEGLKSLKAACVQYGLKCAIVCDAVAVGLLAIKTLCFNGEDVNELISVFVEGWGFWVFWTLCFYVCGYKFKQEFMAACTEISKDNPNLPDVEVRKDAADWMRLKYYKMSFGLTLMFPLYMFIIANSLFDYLLAVMLTLFPVYQIFKFREIEKVHPEWTPTRVTTYHWVILVLGFVGSILVGLYVRS